MSKSNGSLFFLLAIVIGMEVVLLVTPDWLHQGSITLRPVACSLAKSAGATLVATDIGCTVEGQYDIGRSFTEIRLLNKNKLLINNVEISGIVEKQSL